MRMSRSIVYTKKTHEVSKDHCTTKDLRVDEFSDLPLLKKYVRRSGEGCGGSCDGRFQRYGLMLRTDRKCKTAATLDMQDLGQVGERGVRNSG